MEDSRYTSLELFVEFECFLDSDELCVCCRKIEEPFLKKVLESASIHFGTSLGARVLALEIHAQQKTIAFAKSLNLSYNLATIFLSLDIVLRSLHSSQHDGQEVKSSRSDALK